MFNNPNEGSEGKKSKESFYDHSKVLASSKKKLFSKLNQSKFWKDKPVTNLKATVPDKLKPSFILEEVLKMYWEMKPYKTLKIKTWF